MNRRTLFRRLLSFLGLVVALSFGLMMTETALAATTINVNSTAQEVTTGNPGGTANGNCTLGEAILAANTNTTVDGCTSGTGAPFTINLITGTYPLTAVGQAIDGSTGLPSVTSEIVINGGGSTITRSGTTSFRIFHVSVTGNLTLNSLTVNNGRAGGGGAAKSGGGIINFGTLTVSGVTLSNNSANGSSARGGGIFNLGVLNVSGSTFTGNFTTTTSAAANGGGLDNSGTANVSNSSFSGNSAASPSIGAGVSRSAGTLTLTNTTLSSNSPGGNCGGTITDGGGNTSDDLTCPFTTVTPDISINDVTVSENGGAGSFTVSLSIAGSSTIQVGYTFNNGSAVNGSDFSGANGTLTFIAGDTSEPIPFTLFDDGLADGTKNFSVTLNLVSGTANITDSSGTATINDDEGAPTLSINSVTVGEGDGSGNFTVTLSPASAGTVTVDYGFTNGTADGGDYTGVNSSLTFISGETSKNIPFSITQDVDIEGNQDFSVTLSNPGGASIGTGTGVATITDDEGPVTININSVTVNEGDGTGSLTVTLSAVVGGTVTVDYAFTNGSADGTDFGGTNSTLTFNSGTTSLPIPFTLADDAVAEGVETFTVTLSNAMGGPTIGTGTGSVTINDNEAAAGLSANDVNVNENAGTGAFTVTLSPAAGSVVTVDYVIADGTAVSLTDYTATMSGTITFNIGETSQTVPFTVFDDTVRDGTKTFSITLSNSSGPVIADATGVARIIDNESPASPPTVVIVVAPPYFPPPPPLPPCDVQDDAADSVFRINVTNSTNRASCRPIIQDGKGEMGAVGIQAVIDNGVLQALDVYGVDTSGGQTIIEICLKGQGGIIFLDAKQQPRQPQWMPTSLKDGFTCTIIPNDGMVVLVVNNGFGGASISEAVIAPLPADAVLLSACRVTTTNMVNIRPVPSVTDNEPLDIVPFDLTLEATARTGDFFRVIYLDFQGWIHKDYLTTRGSCG